MYVILSGNSHVQNIAKRTGSGNRAKYCLDFHMGHRGGALNWCSSSTVTHQRLVNRKNDKANKIVADLNSRFGLIYIQDENLSGWQKTGHGKAVQHSCLGRVKARLKAQDNVYVVNRWEPTTQQCINCGDKHSMPQSERTFKCKCGLCMPRDLHSANRMVQEGRKLVPPERREFMRADWWATILPYLGQGKSVEMTLESHTL